MPKEKRFFVKGHHYHLTHRCHNRSFLLRFARDRDAYRNMLRDRLARFRTPLLGYCITSNHVHLMVTAMSATRISELMESLEGDFAQYYNLRKKRSGAFWGGRYRATAIEDSIHLWQCLIYIELNMVRAGVVEHPEDWKWCSYGELIGLRQRYRLVDRKHFERVMGQHPEGVPFRKNLKASIEQRIAEDRLAREPVWSESLAIGSERYIDETEARLTRRIRLEKQPPEKSPTTGWILREASAPYG